MLFKTNILCELNPNTQSSCRLYPPPSRHMIPLYLQDAGNHGSLHIWLTVQNDIYIFSSKFSKHVLNILEIPFFFPFSYFLCSLPFSLSIFFFLLFFFLPLLFLFLLSFCSSFLFLSIEKIQSNRSEVSVLFLCVFGILHSSLYNTPFPTPILSGTWALILQIARPHPSKGHIATYQPMKHVFPQSINLNSFLRIYCHTLEVKNKQTNEKKPKLNQSNAQWNYSSLKMWILSMFL